MTRPSRRSLFSTVVVALSAGLFAAAGCTAETSDPEDGVMNTGEMVGAGGNVSGSAGQVATGGGAIGVGATSTGGVNTGGDTPGGGVANVGGTVNSGGTPGGGAVSSGNTTSGGASQGGESQGGVSTAGASVMAEPCEDIEPPPDPEWPDATCASWAAETESCSEAWFSSYCDISCGRCVPEGDDGVVEPPPCEDIEPPPDPEWPDATCPKWASETESCAEPWFAGYCDISCGRCVPEGGIEPPPCEDTPPPPSDEWPDATCREWALDTEECGAAWFSNYCNISCGRCVPEGGIPDMGVDCSGEGLPEVTGGEGFATRYWDCCQTHCAQSTGHKCGQDGVSITGDGTSSCNGGGSYACYDEAPRAVSDCLAYGHIAKANPNCGACYRIQFTGEGEHKATDQGSMMIKGKQMIVKVTNTGEVAGNQFDLMVPGGGVGQFNACSQQWGTSSLGAQYGGFLAECSGTFEEKKECVRQECMKIPAGSAREGCIWFVDWFQIADNPKFTSQQTDCPF